MKKRRLLSLLLTICMVMSLVPTVAFAEEPAGSEPPVQIEVKNAQNGNTQYKVNDGDWNDLNESKVYDITEINVNDQIYVRAIPNPGQELDGAEFWVDGYQENQDLDDSALQTDDGWSFTYTAGKRYQVCVSYRNGGGDPNPGNPGELRFTCQGQMITGGSIYYKLNGAGDFIQVSEENGQYHSIMLTDTDTSIAIKFVANEGYRLDIPRGVTLRVNGYDAFYSTDTNIADFTSESGYTFDLSALVGDGSVSESSFELEFGFENDGGSPGPEPDDEPAHGGYEGEQITASVTVTGKADFYINDSRMINSNGGTHDVTYTYADNGTVDFYFYCFINQRITQLKVNGVDYYGKLPDPSTEEGKQALVAACKGQLNEFQITVPYSESGYEIVSSVKDLDETDADYMVVGNFLWTYTDQNQGDDYMDNGRMELVKVNYNGRDYAPDELSNSGTAFDWGQDENGGSAVLPAGAVVTVKLVPEYGYQLTSFGINGGDFGTGDEQSTFTFEIKAGNAHLGAHFTQVENKVSSKADIVLEGTIQLGENEIDTGSVVLSVGNAVENVNEDGFQKALAQNEETEEYEIAAVLDINLNQVIYKGNENDVWSNELRELHSPAEITLQLSGDYTDAVVVHEKHNGDNVTYEVIDTRYNSEDGTITFETDSFSNYAVATVSDADIQTPPTEYTITLDANDGTMTVSSKSAAKGATITLTVTPDEGYALESLTATEASGKAVTLTDQGSGKYTFTMPASEVSIKAAFAEIEQPLDNPFVDVESSAYYETAVLWAVKNGITEGTSDTTFSPNDPCTRAQAVTFLWRAAGCPTPQSSEMPFTDVVKGSYYETAVLWAVENGITNGTSATTFSPDDTCNRAQFATFLWRSQGMPDAGTSNPFTDVAEDTYYTDAVLWAVENDITNGTSATAFSPDEDCNRAQTVTFLYRCLGK